MTTKTLPTTTDDLFGDAIYSYTRRQAIEDGFQVPLQFLVDSGKIDPNDQMLHMYRHPVYLTKSVYDLVKKAVSNERHMNDYPGVLWDIMWMSQNASRPINESTSWFVVKITGVGRKQNYKMIVQCGATDHGNPDPAITIMLPEDN